MLEAYLRSFLMLFVTLDALGNIPLFYGLTAGMSSDERRRIAARSTFLAAGILVFFAALGQVVFDFFGVSLSDFKVAGGAILFVIALDIVLGRGEGVKAEPREDISLVPLATPLMAGPAAISTVMYSFRVYGLLPTFTSIVLNSLVAWILFVETQPIRRLLGDKGIVMLSRITAFILAGIAVSMMRSGIQEYLR